MAFAALAEALEQTTAAATTIEATMEATSVADVPVAHAHTIAPRSCPAGHALKYARATKGNCDGCGSKVSEGQLVSDCRECNYYLCTTCTPITACPRGHQLRVEPALPGKCDGCSKGVAGGSLVMSCRECNWYLCTGCQSLMQCPTGHALKPWASQVNGKCDLCAKPTKQGEVVADCRECNWFLCDACHPQLTVKAIAEPREAQKAPVSPLPKCSKGHDAIPTRAGPGCSCDKCGYKIRQGSMSSYCAECNWALCAECHPIRQCKLGHKLEAGQAVAGTCDGCGKHLHENQHVLDCKQCNYYLCGTCHMPTARAGA